MKKVSREKFYKIIGDKDIVVDAGLRNSDPTLFKMRHTRAIVGKIIDGNNYDNSEDKYYIEEAYL